MADKIRLTTEKMVVVRPEAHRMAKMLAARMNKPMYQAVEIALAQALQRLDAEVVDSAPGDDGNHA